MFEAPELDKAAPLAEALQKGGLRVVELTLRTPCALDMVRLMQSAAPDLIIGMGTIQNEEDVKKSLEAGARFLVSPGASQSLLKAIVDSDAPALLGVATPSEAMAVYDAGVSAMKFFPAESAGGVSFLKSLAGPFPEIMFCRTRGISAERAFDYLALPNVACVGGSWVATK